MVGGGERCDFDSHNARGLGVCACRGAGDPLDPTSQFQILGKGPDLSHMSSVEEPAVIHPGEAAHRTKQSTGIPGIHGRVFLVPGKSDF